MHGPSEKSTSGATLLPLSLAPYDAAPAESTLSIVRTMSQVEAFGSDLESTIVWATAAAAAIQPPGVGHTTETWEALASVAQVDVAAARVLEPHLDALSILDEAQRDGKNVELREVGANAESSWGVFAAEGSRLNATFSSRGWRLNGTKS